MFYNFVCDAEAKVDEFVKEGKVTEDAASLIKQMFDNLTDAAYDRGRDDERKAEAMDEY